MSSQPSLGESLDQHRRRVEDSVAKLRSAFDKWRTYSAEYEAFTEELQTLPQSASREDMLAAGVEIEGTVVDELEVKSLLGDKTAFRRNREQVLDAVKHRISYVDENIIKVEKQLSAAEEKLEKLLVISEPDAKTEDGQQIMDIHEILDEDDNVIEATINGKDPNAVARVMDVEELGQLEKILDDVSEAKQTVREGAPEPEVRPELPASKTAAQIETPKPQTTESAVTASADDTGEFMKDESGGFVKVLDDSEEVKEEEWVHEVPNESAEDAQLRREMISYSMQEIGAVVAEINLEESGDFYGYEEYTDDETEEDSEEDNFGRTTQKVVADSYRREMEELERIVKKRQGLLNEPSKKGVRFADELDISPAPPPLPPVEEIPPNADIAPADEDALPFLTELMARSGMTNAGPTLPSNATEPPRIPEFPVAETPKPKGESIFKKEKAMAIPPLPTPPATTTTVAETILERTPVTPDNLPAPPKKKPSRFAAAAAAAAPPIKDPTPPTNSVVAHSILERAPTVSTVAPSAPDDLDPTLHRQEVANTLPALRDKIVREQGGYPDESMVPVDEEDAPRVSRFRRKMEMALPGM